MNFMIKSEHRAIFSTPLGAYELTGISDELKLDEYIESKIEVGDDVTQTHWTLHEDPTLEPFIVKLKECIEHYMYGLFQYQPDYSYEITQMWGNLMPPGCAIYQHSHHNNVIAGVFYPREQEGFPALSFKRPAETCFEPTFVQFNEFNQGSYDIYPQKDMLLLFPAWLQHTSKRNMTDRNRLSFSFNVMVRGRFDTENHLQSTIL